MSSRTGPLSGEAHDSIWKLLCVATTTLTISINLEGWETVESLEKRIYILFPFFSILWVLAEPLDLIKWNEIEHWQGVSTAAAVTEFQMIPTFSFVYHQMLLMKILLFLRESGRVASEKYMIWKNWKYSKFSYILPKAPTDEKRRKVILSFEWKFLSLHIHWEYDIGGWMEKKKRKIFREMMVEHTRDVAFFLKFFQCYSFLSGKDEKRKKSGESKFRASHSTVYQCLNPRLASRISSSSSSTLTWLGCHKHTSSFVSELVWDSQKGAFCKNICIHNSQHTTHSRYPFSSLNPPNSSHEYVVESSVYALQSPEHSLSSLFFSTEYSQELNLSCFCLEHSLFARDESWSGS